MLALAILNPSLRAPFNREMLVGVVAGTPLLWALTRLPESWLDTLAGNLSYGVFLNHFLLILTFQSFWRDPVSPTGRLLALFLMTSIALSGLTYFLIERPVIRMRHRMRKRTRG